jgi:hypothetical protein
MKESTMVGGTSCCVKGNFETPRTLGEICTKKWRLCRKNKERSVDRGGVFGLPIIKPVTLSKTVAHDFQYDLRTITQFTSFRVISAKQSHGVVECQWNSKKTNKQTNKLHGL